MPVLELLQARVSAGTTWRVVQLTDGDGAYGLGEYSDAGPGADEVWAAVAAGLAEGGSVSAVVAGLNRRGPLAVRTVRGALELAAADLAARRTGQPLWRWLGGTEPRPVARHASIDRALRLRTPEEFAEVARAAVADGYRAVKCAPFDGLPAEVRLRVGLARAVAVRRAVPQAGLMVDVHGLLRVDDVLASARELGALGLRWLEDAAPVASLRAVAGIAPLAGGELAADLSELQPALQEGLLAWVLPDLKHAGGFRAATSLVSAALGAGAGVSLHNPAGPVATAAGVHLAVALGPSVETEFAYGETAWRADAVRPAEAGAGAWLRPAAGPGLGLELDRRRWTLERAW
ncbi:enolase C-terminal domain-like protein [Kitasatospora sp. NPDC004745]|uniref:enolase C-terminal domain-like protein n=1 Tax=Kitasatospora sp. NPDC004745 TaxID=3364019 RepID=UPI0036A47D0C